MNPLRFFDFRLLTLLFLAASLNATLVPAAQGALTLIPVLTGLDTPVYVTNARDGTNRLFIVEQPGRIKVLAAGASTPTMFMDIASPPTPKVLAGGERGLLGLAFHPQFATNGRFFVYYTRQPDGAIVVAEYHASADPAITAGSEIVHLVIAHPAGNHNGGMIEFGNDGFLYIGTGDGGGSNDPDNRGQNINDLLGKILRIDIDNPAGGNPYSSPASNPYFGATPGRDEIFAIGMRNPWRFAFDRQTGQLYVGDVGQGALEEIDLVTVGGNYGWRVYEGTNCTGLGPAPCNPANYTPPIAQYDHTGGRCSVTGGYVYRGTASTLPVGTYVFGDFCAGTIYSMVSGAPNLLLDTTVSISSFGEDEAREIYVVGLSGTVHRLAENRTTLASSQNPAPFGAAVTFTATVNGNNPTGSVTFVADGGPPMQGCSAVAFSGGGGHTRTAVCSVSNLASGTHSIVSTYSGDVANPSSSNTPPLLQVITDPSGSSNVALASVGALATASSSYGAGFGATSVNDNARTGGPWGNGGAWVDATPGSWPDYVQINFAGNKTIDRVVVYSIQDNYANPVEPTNTMTFTTYGLVGFAVQGWQSGAWVTLATVSGNNLVKRTVTFPATTTDRIRIHVTDALYSYARVAELEAWGVAATGPAPASVTLGSSGSPAPAGTAVTFTATVGGTNPTGTVSFSNNGNTLCNAVGLTGTGSPKSALCTTSALPVGTHSIVATYAGDANNGGASSAPLSQQITDASGSTNVALASAGGVASASSSYGAGFGATSVNDNSRTGGPWGNGGAWVDATPGSWPDYVQINFAGNKTIDRVVVYSIQDNYANPVEPTNTMTFTTYGLVGFAVQGWQSGAWVTLATVSGNNLVKRTVTFPATTTDRIRIHVTDALYSYARVAELEAWGVAATGPAPASVTLGSSGSPAPAGTAVTFTATVGGTNPTGTVSFSNNGNTLCNAVGLTGTGSPKSALCTTSSLPEGTHSIVATYAGDANNGGASSAPLSQQITDASGSTNVALASAGGVASASSSYGAGFGATSVNDNSRTGGPWGNGGAWVDATPGSWPDYVQINFAGNKTIDRVVVYSIQDNYANPVEPTNTMTFTTYGLVGFAVQGWQSGAWVTLATVSGNNLVKRTVTFPATTTDRIRIHVTDALYSYTRVAEVEAWGVAVATGASGWGTFGRDAQHTALSTTASQPLNRILWQTPVDLMPQYTGNGALWAHYGSPVITPANTVIVPVKTGATGGFRVEARAGSNGALQWSMTTDYVLPPHNWVPSYGPTLSQSRVYFPGAGGTVYFRDQVDAAVGTSGQIAFYGLANYQANPQAYNAGVIINTPLTTDPSGNIYFGFQVTGSNPLGLTSGIARISASGQGTWTPVTTASADPAMTKVPHNSAPALSADHQVLYVAVSNGSVGYLLTLDSTTLAPLTRVRLKDPKSGLDAVLSDNGTASPTVGTDGDVYFGVRENPTGSNHYRGWLLHFNGNLSQSKIPGAFGWDTTASLAPATMVPSYQGTSTYLLMTKYNHYLGLGGDGQNKIAILDPNATQTDPVTGAAVMKEVLTKLGPTPYSGGGVVEWCINTAAVDPITKSVMANSEDGKLYRWDLTTNTLSQTVVLTAGRGEAYTTTLIGPDGKVYATNDATLFAVGQ